jgi:putative membrane protein
MVTMANLAAAFLTKEEQQEVTAAVQKAERVTSGEIVPMIVSRSHEYPLASALGAFAISLPIALGGSLTIAPWTWLAHGRLSLFLAIFLPILPFAYLLIMRWPQLQSYFLIASQVKREVERSALAAFYREELHRTANANGILLYISVLERQVFILGDRGINERLEPHVWSSLVAELTKKLKEDGRCRGICETIQAIGELLRHQFPYQHDDKDELHNLIIRG